METKQAWILKLKDMLQQWEVFLAGLSEAQATAPRLVEDLSLKDIVTHLTAWQKNSAARLQAGLHDEEPDFSEWPPEFNFSDEENVDQINEWIFYGYKEVEWSPAHREWNARFRQVIELAEAVPEENLMVTGKFLWLGHYPLAAVLEGTYNHHREHLEDLRALFYAS